MQPVTQAADVSPQRKPFWKRKLVIRLLYVAYLLVLCELGARGYWWYRGVPFFRPSAIWYTFYPEMKQSGIEQAEIRNDDDTFDVLLLGGSVLHEDYGSIARRLGDGLEAQLGRKVAVHNLALAGKTSRDSVIKYRTLQNQHFDLVVFYHGINDTRMNNCPPALYRQDYSHCSWYKKLELFDKHPEKSLFVLPYSAAYLFINAVDNLRLGWYIPRYQPSPEWVDYGKDIKTESSFRANLSDIVERARDKGERLLVMTFAYYIPADYTQERFQAHQLDYGEHRLPIEIWGKPENVAHGIDVHNDVVRTIAHDNTDVLFIDQQQAMPNGARYYADCCHLSEDGCAAFVKSVLDGLKGKLPVDRMLAGR